MALAQQHGDCTSQIAKWYDLASKATWRNLADVRQTFRSADQVGDKTVFNIKGNSYRLIVKIEYDAGRVYIKNLLTHAEYDKGKWKTQP